MTFYDTQLQQLQEKLARKGQLKAQAAELREQCRTLNSRVNELMGIKLSEQADVDKLEGRNLADFFFDGLFADWAVLDHIHHSQQQVESTLSQIETLLSQLKSMQTAVKNEESQLTNRLDTLIRNS